MRHTTLPTKQATDTRQKCIPGAQQQQQPAATAAHARLPLTDCRRHAGYARCGSSATCRGKIGVVTLLNNKHTDTHKNSHRWACQGTTCTNPHTHTKHTHEPYAATGTLPLEYSPQQESQRSANHSRLQATADQVYKKAAALLRCSDTDKYR